jgi:hypothetical protein
MPRRKQLCKICKKEKEVLFEGDGVQYPVFFCADHGPDKVNVWKDWWDKYHDRWCQNNDFWDQPKEKPSCLMSYFCHKFKLHYGFPYTLDYSNPIPYKNKDFTMVRRILAMFDGNARRAKNYIDWVFAKRIKGTNYTINSLGFFASSKLANEYNAARLKSQTLRRSTHLPWSFLQWCSENCPEIFDKQELATWNDLNGLITHISSYGEDNIEGYVVAEAVKRNMLKDKYSYKKLEG